MIDKVATLWIGPQLSFLERICLKSFANVGQTPILYLYDPIENPPDYVEIRDAREIMDEAFMQKYWGTTKLADPRIHADIFRVLLLIKTDYIWVDTDAYALRPHLSEDGYLFSPRKKRFIPNGVVGMPKDSPALLKMLEFVSATGNMPPWWTEEQSNAYFADHDEVSFETLPVGVTGPAAFGHFIYQTGEDKHASPFHYLYPVLARHATNFLATPMPYDLTEMAKESVSLHLYATGLRRRLSKTDGTPPPGCTLDILCKQTGISAAEFPITHRDDKAGVAKMRAVLRDNEKSVPPSNDGVK